MGKKKKIFLTIGVLISFIGFLYWQNNGIQTTYYNLEFKYLPEKFNDYKILHISDLHNKQFGENQKHLVKKIEGLKPDIIVVTGDSLSKYNNKIEQSRILFEQLADVAPIYFVTGNHESYLDEYNEFEDFLVNNEVVVLRNESIYITKDDDQIAIIGLDDPKFSNDRVFKNDLVELSQKNIDDFTILLSHRPDRMDDYIDAEIDLTFSGHVHGGQIRLPFIGGIISPDQGIFPKYNAGVIEGEDGSMLVISRGLGASIFPQRLFNRPEIILVTLKKEK